MFSELVWIRHDNKEIADHFSLKPKVHILLRLAA
jgi:hypothetical protein